LAIIALAPIIKAWFLKIHLSKKLVSERLSLIFEENLLRDTRISKGKTMENNFKADKNKFLYQLIERH
jgi:hypothetical protein